MVSRTIKLDWSELGGAYLKLGSRLKDAVMRGAKRGAMRAVKTLQTATSKAPPVNPSGIGSGGAVNTAFFKRAWKWEEVPDGARVYNAAAYAGIVEYGRRAGSRFPPLDTIEAWARRRLGLSKKEAKAAAFPIARAIARRGLKGRKILSASLPKIEQDFFAEIQIEIDKELAKP